MSAETDPKRAFGVYYTPDFVVDYMVRLTLGRALEGKTPEEALRLKILDPACGAGAFLLGACRYLLDWHGRRGADERQRILLSNLFGIDLDANAVAAARHALVSQMLSDACPAAVKQWHTPKITQHDLTRGGGSDRCGCPSAPRFPRGCRRPRGGRLVRPLRDRDR